MKHGLFVYILKVMYDTSLNDSSRLNTAHINGTV